MLGCLLKLFTTVLAVHAYEPNLLNYAAFKVRSSSIKGPRAAFLIHNRPRPKTTNQFLTAQDLPTDTFVVDSSTIQDTPSYFDVFGRPKTYIGPGTKTALETHFGKFPYGLLVGTGFPPPRLETRIIHEIFYFIEKGRFVIRPPEVKFDEVSFLYEMSDRLADRWNPGAIFD